MSSEPSAEKNLSSQFFKYIRENNAGKVGELLESSRHDEIVNMESEAGFTPLFIASQNGHAEVVGILLKHGANVNQAIKSGSTPLYIASQNGHAEVVGILLKHGANINQAMKYGSTPLLIASQNGHEKIVGILLKHRANINQAEKKYGSTPLFIASRNGHEKIVGILLKHRANINQAEKKYGATPLFIASQNGHTEIVGILLKHGANVNQAGSTPLLIASINGHTEIVKILLKHGANINQTNKNGRTPLHLASYRGHTEIVKILLKGSVDVNQNDWFGRAALYLAAQMLHEDIVMILLLSGARMPNYLPNLGLFEKVNEFRLKLESYKTIKTDLERKVKVKKLYEDYRRTYGVVSFRTVESLQNLCIFNIRKNNLSISDFPPVLKEKVYKEAKEALSSLFKKLIIRKEDSSYMLNPEIKLPTALTKVFNEHIAKNRKVVSVDTAAETISNYLEEQNNSFFNISSLNRSEQTSTLYESIIQFDKNPTRNTLETLLIAIEDFEKSRGLTPSNTRGLSNS